MSGDTNQEYICDGISECLITAFAKLPHVFVVSREASFFYKGKNLKINQVSEELSVTLPSFFSKTFSDFLFNNVVFDVKYTVTSLK